MKPVVVPVDGRCGVGRPPRLVGSDVITPADWQWWAWTAHAACRGVGPDEFFGAGGRGRRRCRVCPVVEVCFWWAVVAESDLGYRFGIWGGAPPAVRANVARVTGVDYARARLAAAVAEWAQERWGRPAELTG